MQKSPIYIVLGSTWDARRSWSSQCSYEVSMTLATVAARRHLPTSSPSHSISISSILKRKRLLSSRY